MWLQWQKLIEFTAVIWASLSVINSGTPYKAAYEGELVKSPVLIHN